MYDYYLDLNLENSNQKSVVSEELFSPKNWFLSDEVSNWIVKMVMKNPESVKLSSKNLHAFRLAVKEHILNSLSNLHCANLRTTAPNCNLFMIAQYCEIPEEALPFGISIIVTTQSAFYYPKGCNYTKMIVS